LTFNPETGVTLGAWQSPLAGKIQMKILNIIQCANLGGMEQSTLETMRILREAGHDVLMISLHPVGTLGAVAEKKGIPLYGTPSYRFSGLGNIRWMLRQIRKFDPDRIWLTGHNFGSLLAAYFSGRNTYLSIHFVHCERPILLWRIFYFLARRICSGIRFITRFIYQEVESLLDGCGNVVCFPNIFREPVAQMDRSLARRQLEIAEDVYVIGNAGWLIRPKAFDVFLETAALVKALIPNAVFLIAGDGAERENLEQLARALKIEEGIKFIGWQTDLNPFFSSLDVLLFNSNFDALGRTPIEAMCYGVPVVASVICGGLDEFIRSGIDGYLIDSHDPQKLANEIKQLHDHPNLRDTYVRNGRERVIGLGSPEQHLRNLIEFMDL